MSARRSTPAAQVGISIDGREHTLGPDELSFAMEPLDGYQVESEAGRAVALALELDDDLIREGHAREVVRAVQNARKESGLEISDRIELVARRRLRAARRCPRPRGLRDRRDARDEHRLRRRRGATEVTVDGRPLAIAVRRAG